MTLPPYAAPTGARATAAARSSLAAASVKRQLSACCWRHSESPHH
jgi:hypothetical protein